MYKEDTIAAVATPAGEGGVAIVRLSGLDAERISREVFSRNGGKNGSLRSHTLHHGVIRNPDTGQVLDEVLLAVMRKPRSYTGEDVVEVHCHGGPFVARAILEVVLSRGARHADPGEFTKRAFFNGRMDLVQAEGVLDLIRARTTEGMRVALEQVRGGLSKWVGELREELIDILVQVEAAIDFPEEEIELLKRSELVARIGSLGSKIEVIIDTYDWGRLFREGARVCIIGRPNVGKSSLLNALLGEERVIVTPVPGTTRDVIEEGISLAGLPVVLWDTAGVRESDDQIEKLGVERTLKHLEKSDAALVVLDGSVELAPEDERILAASKSKKRLIVINKSDLEAQLKLNSATKTTRVSARTGEGLDALRKTLRELLLGVDSTPEVILTNLRHKASLERSRGSLKMSADTLRSGLSPELIAVDLHDAKEALEEIIGVVSNDAILERIFSNFCIGK
jgi:tRNA modification GTPase